MAQLQLVNGPHFYLKDTDQKCSRCKSTRIEITPAVAWHATGNNPTRIVGAYKTCVKCGHTANLTEKENLEAARYVLNATGVASELLGHDCTVAADQIVTEAEAHGRISHAEAKHLNAVALAKTVFGSTFNSAATLLDAGTIEEGEARFCTTCGKVTYNGNCPDCSAFAKRTGTQP